MRSVPLQLQRPPHPPRLAPIRGFLFFSAPEPLVILFPRRFKAVPPPRPRPRRRRILIGNLYRTTRFSHPHLFLLRLFLLRLLLPRLLLRNSPPPLVSANGLSRGSGYGNGWRRWSLRVSASFCFCSAFHRGIGNAYFITPRCLAGRGLLAAPSPQPLLSPAPR